VGALLVWLPVRLATCVGAASRRQERGAKAADNTDTIKVEQHGRVAIWTMNQPKKLNPLNVASLTRMSALFVDASTDPAIDAVVLTGSGRYFSSGAAFADVGIQRTIWPSSLHSQPERRYFPSVHPLPEATLCCR
jgi:enoyl-CoA hydratase/carnithine racemase